MESGIHYMASAVEKSWKALENSIKCKDKTSRLSKG
jgi:hypothetical protein